MTRYASDFRRQLRALGFHRTVGYVGEQRPYVRRCGRMELLVVLRATGDHHMYFAVDGQAYSTSILAGPAEELPAAVDRLMAAAVALILHPYVQVPG